VPRPSNHVSTKLPFVLHNLKTKVLLGCLTLCKLGFVDAWCNDMGVITTETLAISPALVNYGTVGNSAPSVEEIKMCVLVIYP
jgi:hypothetical protein